MEAQKQETERKIGELQANKSGSDQKFILSPEQQKELENYRKTAADANRDLQAGSQESAQGYGRSGILDQVHQHRRHAGDRGRDRRGPGHLQTQTHSRKMNRKQLTLLLVTLVVIGGAGLVLVQRNQSILVRPPGPVRGQKLFKNFQINDVAAIHIKGDTDLKLARKENSWRVQQRGDYPANYSQVSG